MRIAVYSGSFNPLHTGHLAIMEALTRDSMFDWVYLVVSPQNPLKDAANAKTGRERYRAAVEAVKRHPGLHVWVDDIELRMPPPQYTVNTLEALQKREPDNEFTLVMGADNLDGIHKWREYQRILSQFGVVVYPRTGFDLENIKRGLMDECSLSPAPYRIRTLDLPTVDISSTEIREGLARGMDMSRYLM